MFLCEKTQYYSNINSLQFDLQIQHNPNPNFQNLFVEIDKLILKCIWKCKYIHICIYLQNIQDNLFIFTFWLHSWHVEVPGPGIEPTAQKQPGPQQ